MHRVYLDNSATTPLLPEVLEAMRPYFIDRFGNASSIHHHGQETRAAVEAARESVAALIGCRASEVVLHERRHGIGQSRHFWSGSTWGPCHYLYD